MQTEAVTRQMMNQNCAEMMLSNAAERVLGYGIAFQYGKRVDDEQVDLSAAFMFSADEQKQTWHSGKSQETLEADIENKLAKEKVYFFRTGIMGGAGHWQILYHEAQQQGWIAYSSPKNNKQITRYRKMTQEGLDDLVSPKAQWGEQQGQRMFLIVEASKQNLINAANFLYNVRMLGEEPAMDKLYDNQPTTLYQSIAVLNKLDLGAVQIDPNNPLTMEQFQSDNALMDSPDISALTQVESSEYKVKAIVKQLITNIQDKANGRCSSRYGDWKISQLKKVLERLKQNPKLGPVQLAETITDIEATCCQRRNTLHFWAEPHSVLEFQNLLKEHQLNITASSTLSL